MKSSVLLYPFHGVIDNGPLSHEPDPGLTDHSFADRIACFKCTSDLFKIFSIHKQGLVSFPDTFPVFQQGAVFCAVMFSRILCSVILNALSMISTQVHP